MKVKEYLKTLENEEFNDLYERYVEFYGLKDKGDKLSNLTNCILLHVEDFMEEINLDQVALLMDIINDGKSFDFDDYFFDFGLIYLDDDLNTISCTDLIDEFKKYISKEFVINLYVSRIMFYLLNTIILPFDFVLTNYLKRYQLFDITINDIINFMDENEIEINYNNKYFYINDVNESAAQKIYEEVNFPIKYLNEDVFEDSRMVYNDLLDELASLDSDMDIMEAFMNLIVNEFANEEEFIAEMKNKCKITKKQEEKIISIYNEYRHVFRYFYYGGRTIPETVNYDIYNSGFKYKKNMSLRDCLEAMNDNGLSLLNVYYKTKDIDKLYDKILDRYNKLLDDEEEYEEFISYQFLKDSPIIEDDIHAGFMAYGIMFVANRNDEKVLVIPKEFVIEDII